MKLFSVTESIAPGLPIVVEEGMEPHIRQPRGCSVDIRLHPRTISVINESTDTTGIQLILESASVDHLPDMLLLKPEVSSKEERCLVHVGTAGGVSGFAYLTATVPVEVREYGRIRKHPAKFPPIGIQAYCMAEELSRIMDGVELLDVMLLMEPGAGFSIRRSGALEGAPAIITLNWTGSQLHLSTPIYRRPYTRAAPTESLPAVEP